MAARARRVLIAAAVAVAAAGLAVIVNSVPAAASAEQRILLAGCPTPRCMQ